MRRAGPEAIKRLPWGIKSGEYVCPSQAVMAISAESSSASSALNLSKASNMGAALSCAMQRRRIFAIAAGPVGGSAVCSAHLESK